MKIGFFKFARLRPRQCILAGAAGTHSVCVCTLHQNVKLMIAGGKRESLIDDGLKHYRHCFSAIQCNPPNIECYSGTESLIYVFIYLFIFLVLLPFVSIICNDDSERLGKLRLKKTNFLHHCKQLLMNMLLTQ